MATYLMLHHLSVKTPP